MAGHLNSVIRCNLPQLQLPKTDKQNHSIYTDSSLVSNHRMTEAVRSKKKLSCRIKLLSCRNLMLMLAVFMMITVVLVFGSFATFTSEFPDHQILIGGDPDCRMGFPSESNRTKKEEEKKNKHGKYEKHYLGPCVYAMPNRVEPVNGWLKAVDFVFHNRPVRDWLQRREACLLECLAHPDVAITPPRSADDCSQHGTDERDPVPVGRAWP